MDAQQPSDDARSVEPPDTGAAAVPERSVRRATARRASARRATARRRKDDVEQQVVAYLERHPHSTIGDMAKGLDAHRDTIAEAVSHAMRAGEVTKTDKGYATAPPPETP